MKRLFGLLGYIRPHWRGLVGVLGTMGLSTAIGLLEPWPIKLFVDNVVGDKPWPHWLKGALEVLPGSDGQRGLLLWVAITTVFIFLLATLAGMLNSLVTTMVSQRMTLRLGGDLFAHLQKLSPLFHFRRPLGDTIARVTGDPSCVSILVIDGVVPLVHSLILIVAMFWIIYALQSTLALVSLAVAPFLILSMKVFGGRMKRRSRAQRDYEGIMMNVVERTLSAMPVVQSFTREEVENRRYRETGDQMVRAYRSSIFMSMWFKLAIGSATAVGTSVVLYLGGTYVLDGTMTVGSVLVFIAYLGALYDPLHSVTYTSSTLQYAAAQADRVMEIMETEPDPADAPDAIDIAVGGDVRFEDVSFEYDAGRRVLEDVSLEAHPGEVVAIVGPTGAGKTTLVNMLVRFFDPVEGRITIDGHDLRDVRLKSLRSQVAMVLQDPFIFADSAAENIGYGRPEATPEEIVAAAKAANAHEYISSLPEGYDTVIGERGGTLSGGEKQRLSIARAFLKDAPILILDEPTSALDALTESALMDALGRLMAGRVTFIIAHRLSTIRGADRIVVLDHGRIVESGSHDELLAGGGLYSGLYRRQMEIADHDPVEIVDEDVEEVATSEPEPEPVVRASVVINNHDYADYLPAAIESALAQTAPDTEVVVVDDGSTDESRAVIERYGDRVRAVLKENGGQASALNAGFAASSGDVVCFLDADDLLEPTAMAAALEALDGGDAVKVHWALWLIDRTGARRDGVAPGDELCEGDLREVVLARGPGSHSDPPTSGNAWRRDYLEAVLPIPLEFTSCADAYLLELAPLYGPIERLAEPQGSYRLHGENGCAGMTFDDRIRNELAVYQLTRDALARDCGRLGLDFDAAAWDGDHWNRELARFAALVDASLPAGEPFVLVDEDKLAMDAHAGRAAVPFPERGGVYWGRPADDVAAVAELERQRERGLRFMVVAWPAFWWLDHYAGLDRHLRETADVTLDNDRARVFALS